MKSTEEIMKLAKGLTVSILPKELALATTALALELPGPVWNDYVARLLVAWKSRDEDKP